MVKGEAAPFEAVALSARCDLADAFAQAHDPRVRLVRPEEVSDPAAIRAARGS